MKKVLLFIIAALIIAGCALLFLGKKCVLGTVFFNRQWFVEDLEKRQTEFAEEEGLLEEKHNELIKRLNMAVQDYSKNPTYPTLTKIDNTKTEIHEINKIEARNYIRYIAYLERKLSQLLGGEFKSLRLTTGDE